MEYFNLLFDVSDFPARWVCGTWTAFHGWVHIGSDLAIWASYTAISILLAAVTLGRNDIPYRKLWWLFVAFIFLCGMTHLIEAVIFWMPIYRISGLAKLLTAIVSVTTAIIFVMLAPMAVAIPGIAAKNKELESEIEKRIQAERRARDLFDEAPDLMVTFNVSDGTITESNQTFCNSMGISHSDSVGDSRTPGPSIYEYIHPDWRAKGEEAITRLKLTDQIKDVEMALSLPDGSVLPVILNASNTRNAEGKIIHSTAVWRDYKELKDARAELLQHRDNLDELVDERTWELEQEIEARSQAEQEVKKLALIYHTLVKLAPVGIYNTDKDGRCNFVNDFWCNMTGITREEATGFGWVHGLHPDDRERVFESWNSFIKDRKDEWYEEFRYKNIKNGQVVWSISRSVPIKDEAGNIRSFIGTSSNITELYGAKDIIRKKAEDMETLLYVTSHDLKEPLRAIDSFSRLVHTRYADQLDEKGKDFLNRVIGGAERMNQLLTDVLALSRAQRMEEPKEKFGGNELVKAALQPLQLAVKESKARIKIDPNLPGFVVNRTWAVQAIQNYLANALKFTEAGRPPEIEVEGYQGPRGLGLVVRDRGPGVDPKYAERIFVLFQRAVARDIEGTGAGLAIVRQVAERHGGEAWVEPREGGGANFYITFGNTSNEEQGVL